MEKELVISKTDLQERFETHQVAFPLGATYNLFGSNSLFKDGVLNAITSEVSANSTTAPQSNATKEGVIKYPHPVNYDAVYGLKDISGHHSSCIQAKKYATVGLGFVSNGQAISKAKNDEEAVVKMQTLLSGRGHVTSRVDTYLDPLTNFGFSNELIDAAEDFMDTGTGYLEVHRNKQGDIDGISQIPAKHLTPCTYNGRIYYEYRKPNGTTLYWALFGRANKAWLLSKEEGPFSVVMKEEDVSEVIPFIQPSNRTKYYGYPDWLSASVDIDLIKKAKQYKADFYHNRGVIDKVLMVSGESVNTDTWKKVEQAFANTIGAGNNFNSIAFNFKKEGVTLQVENLGSEQGTEEQFSKDMETLTQNVVSSHGVPPLLANILIPGKLGASNEFINALIGFQLLRVNAYQNVFEKMLAKTLGGTDGVKALKPDDFKLHTITGQMDLASMDTVGRMRSEAVSGENKDRDLSKGVKD